MRRLPNLTFPIRLDLGCGHSKIDGFVGFDQLDFGQEIVWNFNQGIPLPDNSVEKLHSSHTLEHVRPEDLPNFFSEIVRICVPDAWVTIIVPHADTDEAHYLCHYSLWNESKMRGVVKDSPNIEIRDMSRDGIHFISELIIKK